MIIALHHCIFKTDEWLKTLKTSTRLIDLVRIRLMNKQYIMILKPIRPGNTQPETFHEQQAEIIGTHAIVNGLNDRCSNVLHALQDHRVGQPTMHEVNSLPHFMPERVEESLATLGDKQLVTRPGRLEQFPIWKDLTELRMRLDILSTSALCERDEFFCYFLRPESGLQSCWSLLLVVIAVFFKPSERKRTWFAGLVVQYKKSQHDMPETSMISDPSRPSVTCSRSQEPSRSALGSASTCSARCQPRDRDGER